MSRILLRFEHAFKTEMLHTLDDLDEQYRKSVRDAGTRILEDFAQRVAEERDITVEKVMQSVALYNLLCMLDRAGELPASDHLEPARIGGIITA